MKTNSQPNTEGNNLKNAEQTICLETQVDDTGLLDLPIEPITPTPESLLLLAFGFATGWIIQSFAQLVNAWRSS